MVSKKEAQDAILAAQLQIALEKHDKAREAEERKNREASNNSDKKP